MTLETKWQATRVAVQLRSLERAAPQAKHTGKHGKTNGTGNAPKWKFPEMGVPPNGWFIRETPKC